MGVSIVLYRSPIEAVIATLTALAAQTTRPARVAIHANAMSEANVEAIRPSIASALDETPFDLTATAENVGFAEGHNALLGQLLDSGCDSVLVLNPDLILAPDALAELDAAAATLPQPALLGPLLELGEPETLSPTGRIDSVGIRWSWGGRHLDDRQGEPMSNLPAAPTRVAGISGACLYVSRAAFERVVAASGEFFDADFIAYREDAELAFRANVIGVASYLIPTARGVHARRLRGTTRGTDPAIDSLGVRNRFLIAFKYGARRPGGLIAGLTRDGVVIAAVLLRERSSLSGLRDAWRLRRRMREKGRRVRAFDARQQ